jgi:DNA-binding IclR family transcriptional regulator
MDYVPPQAEGFDRLQHLLVNMRDGDTLELAEAAKLSGLSEDTCRAMLEGLARAGLMSREDEERFVRRCRTSLAPS